MDSNQKKIEAYLNALSKGLDINELLKELMHPEDSSWYIPLREKTNAEQEITK